MIDPLSEQFPLETWFESFRRKPINELDVNDICIACRQNQADDQVLGAAIAMLCETPDAGEQYAGELLVSLSSVAVSEWKKNPVLSRRLLREISQLPVELQQEFAADIEMLRQRLEAT